MSAVDPVAMIQTPLSVNAAATLTMVLVTLGMGGSACYLAMDFTLITAWGRRVVEHQLVIVHVS